MSQHCVVIQTGRSYAALSEVCINTSLGTLLSKGYDVAIIDYRQYGEMSFFEISEKVLQEKSYKSIIFSFDDLYF